MRIASVLHFVAGVGVVVILAACLVGAEGKKVEEKKKNEVTKPETNAIKTPTLLSFFRRLLPEKTIESIRAAVTHKPQPKAKALNSNDARSRSLKSKKKPIKETKTKVVPTPSSSKKVKPVTSSRLRTAVNPKTTTTSKVKVTPKVTKKASVKPQKIQKQKTGKELKSRQNSKTSFSAFKDAPPTPDQMMVLTHDQKRNRLRQELVRETEDNCLAKILCGSGAQTKPKQQNTMISDTAYLIKEFFNIFDFSPVNTAIDEMREEIKEIDQINQNAYAAEDAERKKQEEEEEEEEDDIDDEEDDIYRKTPVSAIPKKKKYTTRNPSSKEQKSKTTEKPVKAQQQHQEVKIPEPVTAQPKTRRPKPVSNVEMTTVGDMMPMTKPTSRPTSTVSSNMNRRGEVVTPSSIDRLTSTLMSTSMSGSATLNPIDLSYSIPLKTAKDDSDDDDGDDEEDDNGKYDDNEEDNSSYHRVTLEELVGDIKLSPSEFDMIRGRSGRSMRQRQPRMKINLSNVTSDKYIQSKLRQMKMVKNEAKQLQIAKKVARSMREPRQCRQFAQVAQELLQTCPLTTEVIKFFNTNLKNGSSIEVKKIPPGGQTQGGGLVLLNNDGSGTKQAYFVDNSPQISNTRIQTDLKNPSITSSFAAEEDQYTVYEKRPNPNPQNANLNQYGQDITKKITTTTTEAPPKKESSKDSEDSDEEQDDEGSDEDEEDEEDDARKSRDDEDEEEEEDEEEQEDDTGSREDEEEYDEDGDDDDYGSEDDSSKNKQSEKKKVVNINKSHNDHNKIQGGETNQPNVKVVVKPKIPKRPASVTPTLPPGIIRVYGVPQPSFDKDFTQLSPIGHPVNLFGDEFQDSPPYKRRRQYSHRTSKKAKSEDDEHEEVEATEHVAYNARIPKHPPLNTEPYVNDGDDDDDEGDNKQAYRVPKKKHQENNKGKPLGGLKPDGDDDDDDDKKVTSSEKKDGDDKDGDDKDGDDKDDNDKDNSAEPPIKLHTFDEPPFVPSVMYNVAVNPQPNQHEYYGGGGGPSAHYGSQVSHYHNQYQYQNVPARRPHAYRPIVRPIKIIPDVNVPITGMNFRPSRDYYRPGRLYPVYGRK